MQLSFNDTEKRNNEDKITSFAIGHMKQFESNEPSSLLTERQVQLADLCWDLSNQAILIWE